MKKKSSRNAEYRRKLISLAVASCFTVSNPLYASPVGPKVVSGQASFVQSGSLLQITNSPNAIINWQSFSIGASEITRFIQQSQASAVLNRVTGTAGVVDPSVILGSLQSNGRVFLINPSGVLFGAGAQIDVAGLVATSLNLSNADFLAGRLKFTEAPGAGGIVNQGNITAGAGGNVYLVGPAVTNSGIITSPKGEVILAAGNSVELVDPGTPNLRVAVAALDNEAKNLGQIIADSGRIGIYAGLINHGGTLRADTVEVGKSGEILLKASKNIVLEPGSVIAASGAPGGVHDGGTVRIVADDTLDMQRGSAVHVDGGVDGGNGGFLELSGKQLIALNGEYTGRARKDGYKHGSLLLDPLNISIGALGVTGTITLASNAGAMVVKQDGTRVYLVRPSFGVCCSSSDFIEVIDTSTNSVIASIDLQDSNNRAVMGMAMSPDGSKLYAVFGNTGSGSGFIRVIDTATNTVATTYSVSGPTNLFGMAVDASNRIYVAGNVPFSNPSTAEMVVIDGNTGTQLANVPVGFNPQQIFANPAGTKVYVTSVHPTLVVQEFATGTNALVSSTPLLSRPNGGTFSADGTKLYLSYSGRIEVRDPGTMGVTDTIPFGADSLALNGNTAYIARGDSATVVDLVTKTAKQSFAIGTATQGSAIGFSSANNRVFAASQTKVTIIDFNTGTDTVAGGVIAHTDAPGATLSLPVSALSGAWTNVTLAATNNVNVTAPIADTDVPAGGSLTLTAGNDVNVNAWIGTPTARFNHAFTLTAGNDVNVNSSIYQGNHPLVLAADANIPAQGIASNGVGNVNIKALGMPVVVDTLGSLTVTGKDFSILGGRSASVAVNVGGLLDANLAGNFTLQGGPAEAETGDVINASASVQANAINIVAAGSITIAGGDGAEISGCCVGDNGVMGGTATTTVNSNATMTAATSINLTAGSSITIRGGDNASVSACCNGMSGGTGNSTATLNTNATVAAGTTLALTAPTLTIRGGDFAEASACCNGLDGPGNGAGTAIVNANATVTAGSNITINTTTLVVRGGNDAEASACCNGSSGGVGAAVATVNANVTVTAGQDLIINATGPVTIAGGNGASASACCNGSDGGNGTVNVAANANAVVSAGRHVNLTATSLTVSGGNNAEASACCNGSSGGDGVATVAANANASLTAGQDMTLTVSGPVVIRGGDNAYASACCNGSDGGNGTANVTTNANALVNAGRNVNLTATSLTVRGGDYAEADGCCNGSSGGDGVARVATSANGTLSATQNVMLAVAGPVEIRGGYSAYASACCNGSDAGNGDAITVTNANATLSAGGNLTINADNVTIRGGSVAEAYATENGYSGNGVGTATTNANATVSAGGNLSITATSLTVSGGTGASATASSNGYNGVGAGTATVNANASVTAGQAMTLAVSGPILVSGGDNAVASAEDAGQNTAIVNANATVSAGTMVTMTNATSLTVRGGTMESGSSESGSVGVVRANGPGTNVATTRTNATLSAADLNYTGGTVSLLGGLARSQGGAVGTNTATAEANASILATGNKTLNVTGDLVITGGSALDDPQVPNLGGALARAVLDPGTLTVTTSGDVLITGGTYTGVGSAYAAMMAAGPINLSVGGTTGLVFTGGSPGTGTGGTGLTADPASPIAVTFTGGGTQSAVSNPALDGASVQTAFAVIPPPVVPPPAGPGPSEPEPNLDLVNQILILATNQAASGTDISGPAADTGPAPGEGTASGAPTDKEKRKSLPVCR